MSSTISLVATSTPAAVVYTTHTPRTTAHDMLVYLRDFMGADVSQEMDRVGKRAIQAALRELANAHNWTYLYQHGRVNTQAPYNTGTIRVQVSSGTYANQVTLTGGTWPTWAAQGSLRIGQVVYEVDRRISSTVLTLLSTLTPAADVSAGTAYTLYQDAYDLPEDFVATDQGFAEVMWGGMAYIHPSRWLAGTRYTQTSSSIPRFYTFMGSVKTPNRLAVKIFPYPDSARTVDFIYKRRSRLIRLYEYTTGTITVDAVNTPTTIIGASTVWDASMPGAVIRLSSSTITLPTGPEGENPAVLERNIKLFNSTTSLTTDDNANASLTAVKYRISDPVDVEDGAMLEAFFRCCEKHASIMRNMKQASQFAMMYEQALVVAKEADNRNFAQRVAGADAFPARIPLRYMPSGPDVS